MLRLFVRGRLCGGSVQRQGPAASILDSAPPALAHSAGSCAASASRFGRCATCSVVRCCAGRISLPPHCSVACHASSRARCSESSLQPIKSPVTCHFEHVSGVPSSWSDSLPSDCHSTRLTLSCFLLVYGSTRFSECTSSHGCLL